ncbi:MAG TPA: NUDIX domain-containing protein [Caulobacteraceae bacterium]
MMWKRRIEPIARPALKAHARLTRGMTLGVRGMVFDEAGQVLLIQHTYVRGWHLPGGGVERHETAEEALARELVEEAGVEIAGAPALLGVYSNIATFRGDHVLVYRIDDWRACAQTSRGEIHAIDWFAPDALPDGVTEGTQRRIDEALGRRKPQPHW